MDNPQPVNSPTTRAHKYQLAWQILVPLLVLMVFIIAAAVLVASNAGTVSSTWADVSIIWLIAPMLIFALIFIIVLGFMIYGITRLIQVTPRFTGKTQDFFSLLSSRTRKIANGSTQPFFWFQQAGAVLRSIFRL
jgi:hypothetical protein